MMARKPIPPSLVDAVQPAPTPQSPSIPSARKPAKPRAPSRQDKRGVAFWLAPEAFRQLSIIAAEDDQTIQALMEEAVDDLFRKRGKHPMARRADAA